MENLPPITLPPSPPSSAPSSPLSPLPQPPPNRYPIIRRLFNGNNEDEVSLRASEVLIKGLQIMILRRMRYCRGQTEKASYFNCSYCDGSEYMGRVVFRCAKSAFKHILDHFCSRKNEKDIQAWPNVLSAWLPLVRLRRSSILSIVCS